MLYCSQPVWIKRVEALLEGTEFLLISGIAVPFLPSVLYFSIHRYEGGNFWPHLPESDSHAVGRGRGEGYNINVPWNQVGKRRGVGTIIINLIQNWAELLCVKEPVQFIQCGSGL